MYALTMITLSTAVVVFSSIAAGAGALTWLSVLYYCSYIKLAVTLIKYIPQVYSTFIHSLFRFLGGSPPFFFRGSLKHF